MRSSPLDNTSQSLIGRVRDQDEMAWSQFVGLYSPMIYYWCQKTGLPDQELDDVFQDVLHAIARSIHQYEVQDRGSFRGWLRTVTRNKVMDHFRKKSKRPDPIGGSEARQLFEDLPDQWLDESAGDDREKILLREMIMQALQNIKPHFKDQTWRAFWLVAMESCGTDEVAARLGMRAATVRVAKSRVLKRLRQEFGDLP